LLTLCANRSLLSASKLSSTEGYPHHWLQTQRQITQFIDVTSTEPRQSKWIHGSVAT